VSNIHHVPHDWLVTVRPDSLESIMVVCLPTKQKICPHEKRRPTSKRLCGYWLCRPKSHEKRKTTRQSSRMARVRQVCVLSRSGLVSVMCRVESFFLVASLCSSPSFVPVLDGSFCEDVFAQTLHGFLEYVCMVKIITGRWGFDRVASGNTRHHCIQNRCQHAR